MFKIHNVLAGVVFSVFNFSLHSGYCGIASSYIEGLHKEGVNYFLDVRDGHLKKIEEKTNESGERILSEKLISLKEIPYWTPKENEHQYWFIGYQEPKGKSQEGIWKGDAIKRLKEEQGLWFYVEMEGTGVISKKEEAWKVVLWFPNWPGLDKITNSCLIDKDFQGVMFVNCEPKDVAEEPFYTFKKMNEIIGTECVESYKYKNISALKALDVYFNAKGKEADIWKWYSHRIFNGEDYEINVLGNKFIAQPCFVNYNRGILSFAGIALANMIVSFDLNIKNKNKHIIQYSVNGTAYKKDEVDYVSIGNQMFVWKNSEMPKVTNFNVNFIKR